MGAKEIEAKFTIPDEPTFRRLLEVGELGPFRLEAGPTQEVYDRYRDTLERDILKGSYACRLRLKEEKRIATLKELGKAEGAIHQRAEYEVILADEGDAPLDWPPGPARDLALQLSKGAPLHDLFALRQIRHIRILYDDVRAVAELSLDRIENVGLNQIYFELEAELLPDGKLEDLRILGDEMQEQWGLLPEPRSKFEQGLADLEKRGKEEAGMEEARLTSEEGATLEWVAAQENPTLQRRARLLLAWDEGATLDQIGERAELSRSRVYHWLRAFKQRRMEIFPAEVVAEFATRAPPAPSSEEIAEQPPVPLEEPPPPEPEPLPEREALTVTALCRCYNVDMAHARHVADLALALFDLTADVHGLPPERRPLLEIAAILHNVGLETDPFRHHTAGRDIILAHPLVELDDAERQMIACTTFLHRKKIKDKKLKAEVLVTLPPAVQGDTLVLAALVRMADGLDYSQSQGSDIGQAIISPQAIAIPVSGLYADEDAARAQQKADLWHRLFDVQLLFESQDPFAPETDTALAPVIAVKEEVEEVEKPEQPGVLADDPMSEAGRKVWRFHFKRMLMHEPGTRLGEDIEALHDMRVATRRMRSAFRVFAPYFEREAIAPFLKGLRRTGRALGAVRDLDVFMEKAQRYLKTLPEDRQDSLDPLLISWRAQRETAREQMMNYLDGEKYQRFGQDFGEFLDTPGAGALPQAEGHPEPYLARHVAPRLIYTRYEAVRAYETVLDGAPIETLHALRIDCKRLRYTLEFFREVLGQEAGDVIREVVVMQDHLGDLHDADVADTLLRDFLAGGTGLLPGAGPAKPEPRRVVAPGVAAYLAVKQTELKELLDTFPAAWNRLNCPEVRRNLALAVSVL